MVELAAISLKLKSPLKANFKASLPLNSHIPSPKPNLLLPKMVFNLIQNSYQFILSFSIIENIFWNSCIPSVSK